MSHRYITPAQHAARERQVHRAHRQDHIKPVPSPLHVIAVVSNPMRYASRYRLYRAFEKYVEDSGAELTTVELALGNRHFEITDHHNARHLQLRSPHILWSKENMINLALRHLPADAEYVAWVDADVVFSRPDWATETVHLLQTFDICQMWSHSIDMGPDGQPIAHCTSFMKNWVENEAILQPWSRVQQKQAPKPGFKLPAPADDVLNYAARGPDGSVVTPPTPAPDPQPQPAPGLLHTGYAWAARRSALEALGGLGEIGILGSGDRHMAYALIGEVEKSFPGGIHPNYREYWLKWQRAAERYVRRNVGFMNTTLLHQWHGSKQHRRYQDRWTILVQDKFDPQRDVRHSTTGVLEWTGENPKLERDVRTYFAVRNEDSVDL